SKGCPAARPCAPARGAPARAAVIPPRPVVRSYGDLLPIFALLQSGSQCWNRVMLAFFRQSSGFVVPLPRVSDSSAFLCLANIQDGSRRKRSGHRRGAEPSGGRCPALPSV